MSLLTIDEIRKELDQEFIPLEPLVAGLRLIVGGASISDLSYFENVLGSVLPSEFRGLIGEYDFGRLTIGPVVFCNNGDYLQELVYFNSARRWWGAGLRPNNLLMIANSDPYVIVLDLRDGSVLAMDREFDWRHATRIADRFDFYVRGVGTMMLRRGLINDVSKLSRSVAEDVKSENLKYWTELAK